MGIYSLIFHQVCPGEERTDEGKTAGPEKDPSRI